MSEEETKDPSVVVVGDTGASFMRNFFEPGASCPIKDPVPDVPVVSGKHGRAWLCDNAAGHAKLGKKAEDDACLDHWVIEAPFAHPGWHSYSIVLVHLRPMPDDRPSQIYLPCATHEFWVFAINPDADRRALLADGIVGDDKWLHPGNFAAQFTEITDDLARERIRRAVQAICDGRLSPDTDHRQAWVELFNNSMIKREFR